MLPGPRLQPWYRGCINLPCADSYAAFGHCCSAGQHRLSIRCAIDKFYTMRLEITQKADLAVRALVVLDQSGERLRGAHLAEILGTTAGFMPQAMAPLVRAGWVRSVPGPTGGYEPVGAVGELSVLAVVEAVDGPTDTGRCVVADRACDAGEPCALHVAWGRARRELRASLGSMPLTTLAKAGR
jgi:Rrf2 family transcriptional regulator, iron-sulfur cluster assembly transcription factor